MRPHFVLAGLIREGVRGAAREPFFAEVCSLDAPWRTAQKGQALGRRLSLLVRRMFEVAPTGFEPALPP